MSNFEQDAITAIVVNKDVSAAFEENVDNLFVSHKDIWEGVKGYYFKYKVLPSLDWVEKNYKFFEPSEVKDATKSYIDSLRDNYIKTKLRNMFIAKHKELEDGASVKVLEELFAEISDLNRMSNNIKDLSIKDIGSAEQYYEALAERSSVMGGSPGILTGFSAIDTAYHTGMAPGHLIVMIGWPSRGKTWFADLLAIRAIEQGNKSMIISLEMSPESQRDRIYTLMGEGDFRNSDFSKGSVDIDQFKNWSTKKFESTADLTIISTEGYSDITPAMIQGKIDQHKPNFLVVDYHQLLTDNHNSRSEIERNRNISRQLKRLAGSNSIPILDIAAVTMDDVSDQKDPPTLEQVAWSKAIQYDADMAMAVHKGKDSNLIEIVARKNKFGPLFGFFLDWDIDRGVFKEIFDIDDLK